MRLAAVVILGIGSYVLPLAASSIPVAPVSTPIFAANTAAVVSVLNEGFEGTFPATGSTTSGHWGKSGCDAASGSFSAWIEGTSGKSCDGFESVYHPNELARMKFGPLDLSSATTASLSFDAWMWISAGDVLTWGISLDDITYHGVTVTEAFSTTWHRHTLDLASVPGLGDVRGQSSVWVEFVWHSDGFAETFKGILIDNVQVSKGIGGTSLPPTATGTDMASPTSTRDLRIFLPNLAKSVPPTATSTRSTTPQPTHTPQPGNHPPQFPTPLLSTISTQMQYDNSGRLIGAVTTITVMSGATDTDGDPLTYSWSATNGSISGSSLVGSWQRLLIGGRVQGGSARITVNDGHGGTTHHDFVFP